MAKKLSDALAELSVKTKSVEDKITAARTEAKEKLDARIDASKAELEAKKAHFISQAKAVKEKAEAKNSSFKESISQKIEHLKAEAKVKKEAVKTKIEEKKHEFNVDTAEADYYDAVDYAETCIEWAIVALADVETATLEAFKAKANYEKLKNA
jgi:LPS O-antigen subunit length determinant protein (WzzB/FepE family)